MARERESFETSTPPRVLQTRREDVNPLDAAIEDAACVVFPRRTDLSTVHSLRFDGFSGVKPGNASH